MLMEPIQLGPYRLENRIVMSAMTRNRTQGQAPGPLNAEYYGQRATAGLIVAESTAISPTALGWPDAPGIFAADHVAGWRLVTEAVHRSGGRIYSQLWHCGPISHPHTQPDGALPVGPSAIAPGGTIRTEQGRLPLMVPRALELEEIPGIIEMYRCAATNALAAGFDGVEVHAANGFLLDQFLRSSSNRRLDAYGGSDANRCRLLFEVVEAVAGVWGVGRVGVRVSPTHPTVFGIADDDPARLLVEALGGLSAIGVSYAAVVEGSPIDAPPTHEVDWDKCRKHFSGLYIANNGFDRDCAEAALSTRADMVAFGRLFIANPDLVRRFALGAPLNPLDKLTIYSPDHRGYTDYPALSDTDAAV
jgi:N-ethylmaleimide reductase